MLVVIGIGITGRIRVRRVIGGHCLVCFGQFDLVDLIVEIEGALFERRWSRILEGFDGGCLEAIGVGRRQVAPHIDVPAGTVGA